MTKFPLKFLTITLVGLALGLSGCITSSGQYDKVVEVAPENSLLRFYGEAHRGEFPLRVAYADPWEYEEYAGFKNSDVRLEMFYVTVAAEYTSVQYPYTLSGMVDTWHHNAGKPKSWSQTVHLEAPIEEMYYKRYSLNGEQSCAGFQAEWEVPPADRLLRPSRVIFGYLCAKPGQKMSEKTIENTLVNIGVRGVTEKVRRSDPPQLASNFGEQNSISQERRAAAIAIARGGPGTSGNANFPFEFAVPYHEDSGGDEGATVN